METRSLKKRLVHDEVIVGCLLAYNAPWLVEVLGRVGYDFVTYDLEHEPFNHESILHLLRAADSVGLSSIVRMPCSDLILPFLTAGIHGVQVPNIRNKEHAEAVVELTRFPPLGHRTYYAQTRGARYGVGINERAWVERTSEELLVVGMIEDITVVEQLDDVLRVEGIDAFHVGPLDLAQSMGYPPRQEMEAVIVHIVQQCRAAGKYVAVGAVAPGGLKSASKWIQEGAQIVNVASAWLLTHSVGEFLGEVERCIPEDRRAPAYTPVSPNPYLLDTSR